MDYSRITYCIIESYAGYRKAKEQLGGHPVTWCTTSPFLLDKLPSESEHVFSPEQNIELNTLNGLAKASHAFATAFSEQIKNLLAWPDFLDSKLLLSGQLMRGLFETLNKGLLLSKIVEKAEDERRILCVGDPASGAPRGWLLTYGKFDTLYAYLIRHGAAPGVNIIAHSTPESEIRRIESDGKERILGKQEKLLSIFSNTLSSAFYKVWKNAQRIRLYPWKKIQLPLKSKVHAYIYKDCELIEEYFLRMLSHRICIEKIVDRPNLKGNYNETKEIIHPELYEIYNKFVLKQFNSLDFQDNTILNRCFSIFYHRVEGWIVGVTPQIASLEHTCRSLFSSRHPNRFLCTSELNSFEERYMYCYCKKHGIKVMAFEHGVTYGFSAWSEWGTSKCGMLASDIGVYHTITGADAVRRKYPFQEQYVVGLPYITKNMPFKGFKKKIISNMIGKLGKHKVFYVADMVRNNLVNGPYFDTDLNIVNKTMSIINLLRKSYPHSAIYLKLYPTQRYIDDYQFDSLLHDGHVKIVKDIDFRFLRAIADFVVVTSHQSTFGWVWGAGVPYAYFDFEASPSRMNGLKIAYQPVEGMKHVIVGHDMMERTDDLLKAFE